MSTLTWVIVVIVVIGIIWWATKKKKGTGIPQRPQEPTPPETPAM